MVTFTNVLEKKYGKIFMELNRWPALVGFITAGVPNAIAAYLSTELHEKGEKSASIEFKATGKTGSLMKFSLNAIKKGDSVAFVPEFEILDGGLKIVEDDSFEVEYNKDLIDMSYDITNNKSFISCLNKAIKGYVFKDGDWSKSANIVSDSEDNGIEFDEESDLGLVGIIYISTILEILCNNKTPSGDIEYAVPGLGIFKVLSTKNGYNITLTFDKEFKANCKSDKLAEKISALLD